MTRLLMLIVAVSLFTAPESQPGSTRNPLDSRVTIDYRDAPAVDVLTALAHAEGLPLEIAEGDLRPVTITLTNVRLGTALNAVCDNASCVSSLVTSANEPWKLRVTPIAIGTSASLPPRVSFDVYDTPARDVFRALAAAIAVPATLDPNLPTGPVTMRLKNASTTEVLTELCKMHGCDWDFDPSRGLRVTRRQ